MLRVQRAANYLRSGNIAQLRESVDPRQRNSTLRWRAGNGIADPCQEDDEPSVRLCHQESRSISAFKSDIRYGQNTHKDTYRAAVFIVEVAMTKPTIPNNNGIAM